MIIFSLDSLRKNHIFLNKIIYCYLSKHTVKLYRKTYRIVDDTLQNTIFCYINLVISYLQYLRSTKQIDSDWLISGRYVLNFQKYVSRYRGDIFI
jgi:hypothetical protein